MREIVLDTETTGLEALGGDRIVEIGCLELINHIPTGRTFHEYIDPERLMGAEASRITGITDAMLRGKPKFAEVADAFLEFVGDAPLVIHNASFDMGFLNAELRRCKRPILPDEQAIDTLLIARKRFPGSPASLDALCKRFNVDNSNRELHGALLDSELLAEVYLELVGGRQPELVAKQAGGEDEDDGEGAGFRHQTQKQRPTKLAALLTDEERAAHSAFVKEELGDEALWLQAD